MKRSTAIGIFRTMVITVVLLLSAIVVMVQFLESKTRELNHMKEVCISAECNITKQANLVEQLKDAHAQELANINEWFGLEYVGEYMFTAYCTEKHEHVCGEGHGITASGQPVQAGVSVAVGDTDKFPYGTVLYIEGVGIRIVQDTGGGLDDNQMDVAVDTHKNALKWSGYGHHKVYVIKAGK